MFRYGHDFGVSADRVTMEPLARDRCPDCGDDVVDWRVEQPALLRHGGYGATWQTVIRSCRNGRCSWSLIVAEGEVWP